MPVFNNMLAGASGGAGGGGGASERSLRFNSTNDTFLSRTPGSAGDRTKWTWAAWVKRSKLDSLQSLFTAARSGNETLLTLDPSNRLEFYNWTGGYAGRRTSTAVFRDCSAWYHVVLVWDTGNSTPADRIKFIINGVRIETFTTSQDPNPSAQSTINDAYSHRIGDYADNPNYNFNGYLADVYFIDGQALDHLAFTEFDTNGVLQPKAYSGTYGTNGFHLDFKDNSSKDALGYDAAGSNNWDVNNLTAVAGTQNYVTGSQPFKDSTAANRAWDSSNTSSSTSNAIGVDDIYWVDLGSNKSFNKVTFTVVGSGQSTDSSPNFILYHSTSSSSNGSSICNGGCTVTKVPTSSGSLPGTITAEFSEFAAQTARYIGITNGASSYGGTYTYSNFQVSSIIPASDNDSLVDSPINGTASTGGDPGGVTVGNYATWNPLTAASATYTQGNLLISSPSNDVFTTTQTVSSGKYYVEVEVMGAAGKIGIWNFDDTSGDITGEFGWSDGGAGYMFDKDGNKYNNQSAASYGNTYTSGNIIGIALDMDNGKVFFSIDGTFQNSGVPESGSNPAFSGLSGTFAFAVGSSLSGNAYTLNAGQRAFNTAAPSGYKSLNTANLPPPTIADGSKYFRAITRTGGGTNQSFTTLNPGLVWQKNRTDSSNHYIYDKVRGDNKYLDSQSNAQENSTSGAMAFSTNSYVVNSSFDWPSNKAIIDWVWDAGSSTVSNNDGTGTTNVQVRANPSIGFSIVTYTGGSSSPANSDSGDSFGHGLGAAPKLVICKKRSNGNSWPVYHASTTLGALVLDGTNAVDTASYLFAKKHPTSSVVFLGNNPEINSSSDNYVAYCFTPVAGYSAVGGFTNPSSSAGAYVHLGFKPAFLLIKCAENISSSSGSGDWIIKDTTRNPFNIPSDGNTLVANVPNAEDTHYSGGQAGIDILSNGFKIRHPNSGPAGDPGRLYIYYAVAEHPFKNARAR